jgi:hypothetical protein
VARNTGSEERQVTAPASNIEIQLVLQHFLRNTQHWTIVADSLLATENCIRILAAKHTLGKDCTDLYNVEVARLYLIYPIIQTPEV